MSHIYGYLNLYDNIYRRKYTFLIGSNECGEQRGSSDGDHREPRHQQRGQLQPQRQHRRRREEEEEEKGSQGEEAETEARRDSTDHCAR